VVEGVRTEVAERVSADPAAGAVFVGEAFASVAAALDPVEGAGRLSVDLLNPTLRMRIDRRHVVPVLLETAPLRKRRLCWEGICSDDWWLGSRGKGRKASWQTCSSQLYQRHDLKQFDGWDVLTLGDLEHEVSYLRKEAEVLV
jgi:hypothetical protein